MNIIQEAKLVDIRDDDLLDYVGGLYEQIQRLSESKKLDSHLIELKARVRDYENRKYNNQLKTLTAQLQGARNMIRLRNLEFRQPRGNIYE